MNNGLGIWNIAVNVGKDGARVRNVLMSTRNGCTCVHSKLSLGVESWQLSCRSDRTHVEDVKNPVEVRPPGSNRLFIILRVEMPRDRVSLVPLDDVRLYLVHSPDRGLSEQILQRTHRWFNSRRQFFDGLEDRLAKLVRSPSVRPPVEDFANVNAGYLQFDVVRFVDQ